MGRTLLQVMLLFFMTSGSVPVALADFYKYTDTGGAINITNKLESVPQKYRSRVKVVRDEALSKQDPGARRQQPPEPAQEESGISRETAAPAPAPAPQGKFAQLAALHSWFKPLCCLAAFLAAFLLVIKLASLVPSAPLSKLIYLCFFLGVFVFLYQAYVEHVVADSLAVKEKAVSMMQKSMVRELPLPGEAPPAENR